jgi:hypothetical protein
LEHVDNMRLPEKLLQKAEQQEQEVAADDRVGVKIAEQAYDQQDLANQYNIHHGPDLFAARPRSPPPPPKIVEEQQQQRHKKKRSREEDRPKKKSHKTEDQRQKKSKRKKKSKHRSKNSSSSSDGSRDRVRREDGGSR